MHCHYMSFWVNFLGWPAQRLANVFYARMDLIDMTALTICCMCVKIQCTYHATWRYMSVEEMWCCENLIQRETSHSGSNTIGFMHQCHQYSCTKEMEKWRLHLPSGSCSDTVPYWWVTAGHCPRQQSTPAALVAVAAAEVCSPASQAVVCRCQASDCYWGLSSLRRGVPVLRSVVALSLTSPAATLQSDIIGVLCLNLPPTPQTGWGREGWQYASVCSRCD